MFYNEELIGNVFKTTKVLSLNPSHGDRGVLYTTLCDKVWQ
jgi:hypothetical protein